MARTTSNKIDLALQEFEKPIGPTGGKAQPVEVTTTEANPTPAPTYEDYVDTLPDTGFQDYLGQTGMQSLDLPSGAKALEDIFKIVSYPLAWSSSGLKETIDFFQGEGWDVGDFKKQISEGYTFGQLLHDENWMQGGYWEKKWGVGWWLRGGISFTGDVIFDPLTWAGLVGKGVGVGTQLLKGGRAGGAEIAQASIRRTLQESIKGGLPTIASKYSLKAFDDDTMARIAITIGDAKPYRKGETLGGLAKDQMRQLPDGSWAVDMRTIGGDVSATKINVATEGPPSTKNVLDVIEENPAMAAMHDDIVLIPKDLVDDVGELFKMQEVSGISGLTDDQVQLASRHMFLNGMDKNGAMQFDLLQDMRIRQAGQATKGDLHHGINDKWKGPFFNSMEDAMGTRMAFGAKIPLAGPIGRALKIPWAAGKGYPASLKIARVPFSTPVIGPALRSVPQGARRVAFGKDFAGTGRGVIGWLRTGGRYQAMRQVARSRTASPVLRHQARQALSAAGRGQWKGRIVRSTMTRIADQYVTTINATAPETVGGLKGKELKSAVYHALAGDADAIKKIQGYVNFDPERGVPMLEHELLVKGRETFERLRAEANAGAGVEWLGEQPFYVPRILNEDARAYLNARQGTQFGLNKGRISTSDALTNHELSRTLISDAEFEAKLAERVAKGETVATATWQLANEGYTKGFMGYKLYALGDDLEPDHAWVQSGRVASGKAPSIEQQIAYIMEDLNIGYSLFDDDIGSAMAAYVAGVSNRTGDVFTEEILKRKGVFVDKVVSQTSFPTTAMDSRVQELHFLSRRISELAEDLGDLETQLANRGDLEVLKAQYEAKEAALKVQNDAFAKKEQQLNDSIEKQLAVEKEIGELERQILNLKKQSEYTKGKIAEIDGADLPTLVKLQKDVQRIEGLLRDAIGDGRILRNSAEQLRIGTRHLIKNKKIVNSIVGSDGNWQALVRVFKDYDPSKHSTIDEYMNDVLRESVDENGVGQAFDGLITSSGFVGQVDQVDAPNGLRWSFNPPDGPPKNQVDFETDIAKLVSYMDKLDETAFGAWISLEIQIHATGKNLVVNPVSQMENAMIQIGRHTDEHLKKIQEIETVIGRSGIEEEILGDIPTVQNVEKARSTIEQHLLAKGEDVMSLTANPRALKESEDLRNAINTYYGVFEDDFSVSPIVSGEEINSSLEQIAEDLYAQVSAYQLALTGPDGALPPFRVTIKTKNGEQTQEFTLRDYVARRDDREMWRQQMAALDPENFASIDFLLKHGVIVQASDGAKAIGIEPEGSVSGKTQKIQGGTNVGFHLRANVDGDEVDFYVKVYEPNLSEGEEVAVFGEYGHTIDDVGRNRVQAEVLADALYREMRIQASKGQLGRAAPDSWHSHSTSGPDGATHLHQDANALGIPLSPELQGGEWKVARFSEGLAFPQGSPAISDVQVVSFVDGTYALASSPEEVARYQAQANVASIDPISERLQDQMLMDVLLSNADVIGYDSDNIGIDILTGEVIRIDNGASFHYRAQGLPKATTQGFDWRVVDELETADGQLGTFFSEEFENQPSRMQSLFRAEAAKGNDFWLRLGDQLATLLMMRSHHGGWEPFVRKVLGPSATRRDIRMFTDFLEVRTRGIVDILNKHLDGQAPELLEGDDLLKAQIARTSMGEEGVRAFDSIYSPLQTTSQAAGRKPWTSADANYQAIDEYSPTEVESIVFDSPVEKQILDGVTKGLDEDLPLKIRLENKSRSQMQAIAFDAADGQAELELFESPWSFTRVEETDQLDDTIGDIVDDGYLDDENFEYLQELQGSDPAFPDVDLPDAVLDEMWDGSAPVANLPKLKSLTELELAEIQKYADNEGIDMDSLLVEWEIGGLPPQIVDELSEVLDDIRVGSATAFDNRSGDVIASEDWMTITARRAKSPNWSGTPDATTIDKDGKTYKVVYTTVIVTVDDLGQGNQFVLKMPMDDPATGRPAGGREWTFGAGESRGKNDKTVIQTALRNSFAQTNMSVDIHGAIPEIVDEASGTITRVFVATPAVGQPPVGKVATSASDVLEKTSILVNHTFERHTSAGQTDAVPPVDFLNTQNVIRDDWVDSHWINSTQSGVHFFDYDAADPASLTNFEIQTPKGSKSVRILGLPDGETMDAAQRSLFVGQATRDKNFLTSDEFDEFEFINGEIDDLARGELGALDPAVGRASHYLRPNETFSGNEDIGGVGSAGQAWRDHEVMLLEYTYSQDDDTFEALLDFLDNGHTIGEFLDIPLSKEQEKLLNFYNASETIDYNNSRLRLGATTLRTMKVLDRRGIGLWDKLTFKQKLSFIGYLELQGGVAAPWETVYLGRAAGEALTDEEIAFLMAVAPMGRAHKDIREGGLVRGYLTPRLFQDQTMPHFKDPAVPQDIDTQRLNPIRFLGDRRSVEQFKRSVDEHVAILGTEGDQTMLDGGPLANNAISEHSPAFYIENKEFIDKWVKRIAEVRHGAGPPLTDAEIKELRDWTVKNVMDRLQHQSDALVRLQSASERSILEDLHMFLALSDKQSGLGWVNTDTAMQSPLIKNIVGGAYGGEMYGMGYFDGTYDADRIAAGMPTGGTVLDINPILLDGVNPDVLREDVANAIFKIDPTDPLGEAQLRVLLLDLGMGKWLDQLDKAKAKSPTSKKAQKIYEKIKQVILDVIGHDSDIQSDWAFQAAYGRDRKQWKSFGQYGKQSDGLPLSTIGSYLSGARRVTEYSARLEYDSIIAHLSRIRGTIHKNGRPMGTSQSPKTHVPMYDPRTGRRLSRATMPTFEWIEKAGLKVRAKLRGKGETPEELVGKEAKLGVSGTSDASYHQIMEGFLDAVPSLQGSIIVPEALLYQRMLDASQSGLAADGFGAIAYMHYEPAKAAIDSPTTGMRYNIGKGARVRWANVLLANPVSVLNPAEEITRTADGIVYDFTESSLQRPILGGQTFVDEYETWANTHLAAMRNSTSGKFEEKIWQEALRNNPDNPLAYLQEKEKAQKLARAGELQDELRRVNGLIENAEVELETIRTLETKANNEMLNAYSDYAFMRDRIKRAIDARDGMRRIFQPDHMDSSRTAQELGRAGHQKDLVDMVAAASDDSFDRNRLGLRKGLQNSIEEVLTLLDEDSLITASELISTLELWGKAGKNVKELRNGLSKEGKMYMDAGWLGLTKLDDVERERFIKTFEATWQAGFKAYGVGSQGPQEIVESMGDVVRWQAQGGMAKVLRTYDAVHNLVKGYLIGKSGFHSRNFFSGVFMNSLAGVGSPKTYRSFQKAYWKSQYLFAKERGLDRYANSLRNSMRKRGIWDSIMAVSADDVKIIDQMREGGVLGGSGGMTATEFGGKAPIRTKLGSVQGIMKLINKANPLNSRNAFLQLNRDVGVGTETFLRGVLGFDVLKKGGSIDEAFEKVIKYHFDYEDLSMFERAVVKRVFPFYVWTKRALPLMIEETFKQPKKFARVEHFKAEFTGHGEEDTAPIPDYFIRQGGFETPWSYKGEKMWILPDLPQYVVSETLMPFVQTEGTPIDKAVGGFSTFFSNLSPLIKGPLERMTSRNFWKGYNYDGRFIQVPAAFNIAGMTEILLSAGIYKRASNGTLMVRDYDMNLLMTSLPLLGDVRRLLPDEKRYQDRVLSTYLSYFTGIGLRTNTKEEQYRTLQSQGYEEAEIQNMLEWMERESMTQK